MDRNQAKEFYPILQAFAEGKVIECRTKPSFIEGTDVPNDWTEMKDITYWSNIEYRIKPEPKFRPFANAEECWQEMLKHQPFGWTKSISEKRFYFISKIDDNGCFFSNNDNVSFKTLFASDTFADGTPFGIKEE